MEKVKTVKYTVSALGRGYVTEVVQRQVRWSDARHKALEFSSFREATEMLRAWKKLPGFPSHAGVVPGIYAEVNHA